MRCAALLGLRGGLLGLLRLGLLGLERGEQVGLQRVELHPHPLQLAGFGERACGLLQFRGTARGLVRGLARLCVALQLSLLLDLRPLRLRSLKSRDALGGLLKLALQLTDAGSVALQHGETAAQVVHLQLQRGDLSGFVVTAAVQLLFQTVVCLGKRGLLLTGRNERGDAPLQLRILIHGKARLADEGAALKYLARHTEQRLAEVGAGDIRHGCRRIIIGAGELAHRGVGAPRRAQDSIVLTATAQIHASLHGAAVPRGIAVLVGQHATRAGGQAIKHIAGEAAPGGLAALVRGGDDVQTRLQVQRGVAQPPEIGLHMADLQDGHLLIYSRNVPDIITQNPRLVTIGTERKFFEKI